MLKLAKVAILAVVSAAAITHQAQAVNLFEEEDFFVGCNYWASHAGVYMWRDWRPGQIEKDLDLIASCGMSVLRVFPLWPDFQPLTADFGGGQSFHGYSQNGGPLKNGSLWVVAINYGNAPVSCPISFAGELDRVYGRATLKNGVLSLGANDGCVFRIK